MSIERALDDMRKRDKKNEVASVLLFTDGIATYGYKALTDIKKRMFHPLDYSKAITRHVNDFMVTPSPTYEYPPYVYSDFPDKQPPHKPIKIIPPKDTTPYLQKGYDYTIYEPSVEPVPLKCTINTFGFGADHDPNLLKGIAELGTGMYYYIQSEENIAEAFADCLGGLLSVYAQNVTLQFEAQNGTIINKLHTKFSTTVIQPSVSYAIQINDVQSEEQKDILISTTIPAISSPLNTFTIIKVTLSYLNALENKPETKIIGISIQRPEVVTNLSTNPELDKQRNRIFAAEAMEQATNQGNTGNLTAARDALKTCISKISESVSSKDPFCEALADDLKKCESTLKDTTTYTQVGQHMMNSNMNAHYMQRSSDVRMPSQQVYQTSSRHVQQQQMQQFQ